MIPLDSWNKWWAGLTEAQRAEACGQSLAAYRQWNDTARKLGKQA